MKSVQKSLRLAMVAMVAVIAVAASGTRTEAASPTVFGKEPVARHYRAMLARRAQASSGYRMSSQPSTRYYGGTAMVQTYPAPSMQRSSGPMASRYHVMPANGYRSRMAVGHAYYVR